MENKLKLKRETYVKDGKTRYHYYVSGMVRGVESQATFAPVDFGGYSLLDIVFGDAQEVDMVITPYEFVDKSGKVVSAINYKACSVDADGKVYECRVKPLKYADRAVINMILA